jgi:WD40 repeat protein
MFLVGTRDDGVDVWDCSSKQLLTTLTTQSPFYDRQIVAVSSDGCRVAVSGADHSSVTVWDISAVDNNRELCRLIQPETSQFVRSICFTSNGEQLAIGFCNTVALYNVDSGGLVKAGEAQNYGMFFVRVLAHTIVTVFWDGLVLEWDMNLTLVREQQLPNYLYRACATYAGSLMAAAEDNGPVVLVDLASFEIVKTVGGHRDGDYVESVEFSRDDSRLIVVWNDSSVIAYDTAAATSMFEINFCGCVCYNINGETIFGSSSDGSMRCWDAVTGAQFDNPFSPESMAPHGYGRILALSPPMILM